VPSTPSAPTDTAVFRQASLRQGRSALARRWALLRETAEDGMSTAEYAVGTVAACAFAAVLYRVVTGGSVVKGLTELVESALATLS
jgi:glutathione S-transferase